MNTQRCILHADFDAFYISVERVLNPRLRGRPVVVGNRGEKRGVVAAVSAEARSCGIYASMTTARALNLCPSLVVVDGNFDLYRQASGAVSEHLQRFSPYFEPATLDEVYLDLTGTQKLFGQAVDIGTRLCREIKNRFSLDLTVGVAANKLVSKIASRTIKPTGLCDVTPGSESVFLAPLPVHCLPGVGPHTEKRLAEFNIETIGELASAGRPFLQCAFGRRGYMLHAHAQGIDHTPVVSARTPKIVTHEETLTHDSNNRSLIRTALFHSAEKTSHCLRGHRLLAKRVSVHLQYIDGRHSRGDHILLEATDLDDEIYAGAARVLKRILTGRLAVRRVGVRLSHLLPAGPQLTLMDNGRQYDRKRSLISAVDRIRRTYGFSSISYGRVFGKPQATRAA